MLVVDEGVVTLLTLEDENVVVLLDAYTPLLLEVAVDNEALVEVVLLPLVDGKLLLGLEVVTAKLDELVKAEVEV